MIPGGLSELESYYFFSRYKFIKILWTIYNLKLVLNWGLHHRATIEPSSPQDTYGDSLGGRGLQPKA